MNRHIFRGSRVNRDRREQSFARDVIAAAERRRREDEAKADLPERERCAWCSEEPPNSDHHPYCSARCGIEAGEDDAE